MPDPNRQAAAAELREFLAQMRGKSPKEMLGAIASSNLAQSTLLATAAISAAIVLFTILPFGVKKIFGKSEATPKVAAPEQVEEGSAPLETPAEPTLDPDAAADKGSAASRLGIGETKDAPANVNPLESSTDDLLDGIE